jgi:hypothetical protein
VKHRRDPSIQAPSFLATALILLLGVSLVGCSRRGAETGASLPDRVATLPSPQAEFWARMRGLCGRAYRGRVTEGNASDSTLRRAVLVMHVRECSSDTIRIPFHADSDRSRTWVVTRQPNGLRLKHDHRHEDGTADAVTQYGGDTRVPGTAIAQEFFADAHTATLIPAARTNVWTMEIVPGARFAYALRRDGTDRRFRVEFDLTAPVPPPPPPWGTAR